MKLAILSIISFTILNLFTNTHFEDQYSNGQNKVQCKLVTGFFDGPYKSWHSNGEKKVFGQFKNNQRVGLWKVWNEEGELVMKRDYKNSFCVDITNLKQKDKSISTQQDLSYNKDGFINYSTINEKDAIWSKKSWRIIKPSDLNIDLFEKNRFFNLLSEAIKAEKITAYEANNETMGLFNNPLKIEDIKDLLDINEDQLIGFFVKEEVIIDKKRQISEARTIGICPVVFDKNQKPVHLFWLYYPSIRAILAKEKVSNKMYPKHINTFDDVFYFRNYNSHIYRIINIMNSPVSNSSDKYPEISEKKVETDIIDIEHDYWLKSTSK
jgi:hypothetical protein